MLRRVNGDLQEVRPDALTAEIFDLTMHLKEIESREFGSWEGALQAAICAAIKATKLGLWKNDSGGLVDGVRVYLKNNSAPSLIFNKVDRMMEAMHLRAYQQERELPGPFKLEFHLIPIG